jgi:hypothetical protein
MFVARNVFSISFASSAASALETAWTSEQVWRRTFAARLKHSSVTPPTTRGVACWACALTPGSMRSGANATKTSSPTVRPRRSSGSTSSWRVEPIDVVEVRMIVWPARANATTVLQAPRSGRRSGWRRSSTGVGTAMMIASAAAS